MGATRLPGKTLMDISGRPLLDHVIERVRQCGRIDDIVVATTRNAEDDAIIKRCTRLGVRFFRGSEPDVLDRFYRCADWCGADLIARVTADDPFKDPEVIDRALNELISGDFDYVSNTIKPTYPEGIDIEIFTFQALGRAWREAQLLSEREHVTPYIWNHPELFKTKNLENDEDLSSLRWTIDTAEDLAFAREVYQRLYTPGQLFLMRDILALLRREPEMMELVDTSLERNAGYKKSVMVESDREENRR